MGSVDADAHVIESSLTWDHIAPGDEAHRPLVVTQTWGREVKNNEGGTAREYWLMDNRVHAKDRNVGSDTTVESREMSDIAARLDHMDALDIYLQVLYPTVFLRPALRTRDAGLATVPP